MGEGVAPEGDPAAPPDSEQLLDTGGADGDKPLPGRDEPARGIDENEGAAEFRSHQIVFNTIHHMQADSATFGVEGSRARVGRATGPIRPQDVTAALTHHLVAANRDKTDAVLRERKVLLLVGPAGTGKHSEALALLMAVCGNDKIIGVSPALSLSDLASSVNYQRGHGYLVVDHVSEPAEFVTAAHDLVVLENKLATAGAFLVLTTRSLGLDEGRLATNAVRHQPPDAVELLTHCLGGVVLDAETLERAQEAARRSCTPGEIVSLAARLRINPDSAFDDLMDEAKARVSGWIDTDPNLFDLLGVTTLALVGPQEEPKYELMHAMLVEHARPAPENRAPVVHDVMRQSIPRRNRQHPLVMVESAPHSTGRWVRFRSDELRVATLEELHEQYGYQVWEPVRSWLADLSARKLRPEIEVGLAQGLAWLGRSDFNDVLHSFLQRWSGGTASERSTAAMVLWFMGKDDKLAPLALHTAMGWGDGCGLQRAVTAAMALGGPLGLRYPDEAVRRLCFLAFRAKRIAAVARLSLAVLWANAVVESAESCTHMLTIISEQHSRAMGTGAKDAYDITSSDPLVRSLKDKKEEYEQGWNARVVRAARQMVVSILAANDLDGNPVSALVLRTRPESVPILGRLWADVLCSAPHRATAMDALYRTLRLLEHDRPADSALVELGTAIHHGMPAEHRKLRIPELLRVLERRKPDQAVPKIFISTLLAAISGTTAQIR
ncbi:hypothetical protein [Actinokineospora sp. NPDC004072]